MAASRLIYLSVGDDGGGPWAFARGLAGGIAEQANKYGMKAHFIIDGRNDPGGVKGIKDRVTAKGGQMVDVRARNKLLWLPRDTQTNFIDPTRVENDVLTPFQQSVTQYWSSVNITDVDLVIGVVDPCAPAIAKQRKKKGIVITDHTWDETMRLVLSQVSLLTPQASTILDYIGSLYALADRIQLWPEPVAPEDPFGLAVKRLGVDVSRLPGVTEEPDRSQAAVRKHYRIRNNFATVCLSTGAQGALSQIFHRARSSYAGGRFKGYNVVIDSDPSEVFQPRRQLVRVRKLPLVDLGTICDLLVTRGGGGAINAAIASGLPWVTVLEPFHPQVNAIAWCAQQMGLTRCVPYQTVAHDPRLFIEQELANSGWRTATRQRLYQLGWRAESRWADEVIRNFLM